MNETLRQFQARKTRVEAMILLGSLTLIASALLYLFDGAPILIAASVIVGAVTAFFGFSSYTTIQDDFRDNILKKLLEDSVDNAFYNPKQGLCSSQIYQSEALDIADRFNSKSLLSGSLKGVSFVSSDVLMMRLKTIPTNKSYTTTYVTYFSGRVFAFEFNKSFEGALQILETGNPLGQRLYEPFHISNKSLNNALNIFTTNKATTRSILTPSIIEALTAIEKNHTGNIRFSFLDSKFFVAIDTHKNTFELSIFKAINVDALETFKRDLKSLHTIVSILKDREKVFEKETYDFTQSP